MLCKDIITANRHAQRNLSSHRVVKLTILYRKTFGERGRSRTADLSLRRGLLYPAKLHVLLRFSLTQICNDEKHGIRNKVRCEFG